MLQQLCCFLQADKSLSRVIALSMWAWAVFLYKGAMCLLLVETSGTLAQICPCVLRAVQAGPRRWMKGIIKLSAANSSQDWDEVVLLLIIFSFPLGEYAVWSMAKPLLLLRKLFLGLLCSSFHHYTMLLHLNQFKQWFSKSCSHNDDSDTCQRKYLSVVDPWQFES